MYPHDQTQGPRFLWTVGFLSLGTLSAIGAAALFPWYLAVVIAILVAGLASACAFQFRATGNLLYLIAAGLMTALAACLDGVSVWEILNKRQNTGLHMASAEQSALESQLGAKQARVESARQEIALLVEEATNMDNDGRAENDRLIPGKLAMIESKKADLANLTTGLEAFRAKVVAAASTTAQADTGRHVLLQMADKQEEPARWLISRAALVFAIPELTLALLAWSLRPAGAPRRPEPLIPGEPSKDTAGHVPAYAHAMGHHAGSIPHPVVYAIHPESGLPVGYPVQATSAPPPAAVPFVPDRDRFGNTPSREAAEAEPREAVASSPVQVAAREIEESPSEFSEAREAEMAQHELGIQTPISREAAQADFPVRGEATDGEEMEPLADELMEEEWPEPLHERHVSGGQPKPPVGEKVHRYHDSWTKPTPTDQARETAKRRENSPTSLRARIVGGPSTRAPGTAKDRRKQARRDKARQQTRGVELPS